MLESSIHPTKYEILLWEIEDIIEKLKGHEGNLPVLLLAAIKKSEETYDS